MLSDDKIAFAMGFANAHELREFIVWPTDFFDSVRAAIAADRAARAEPVGFVDANGDLIPKIRLHPWTNLYAAPTAASDGMTNEELRRAIRETQDQYMASANYREHLVNHLKELMAIEIERAKCGDT